MPSQTMEEYSALKKKRRVMGAWYRVGSDHRTFESHKIVFNPDYAVDSYSDLKNIAATLVSRFCFSTY
jgi:hypothetical protein